MAHWAQMVRKDRFGKFDYGKKNNLKKYGVEIPPSYDLSKIKSRIALFNGGQDVLANPKDVSRIARELDSNVLVKHLYLEEYAF